MFGITKRISGGEKRLSLHLWSLNNIRHLVSHFYFSKKAIKELHKTFNCKIWRDSVHLKSSFFCKDTFSSVLGSVCFGLWERECWLEADLCTSLQRDMIKKPMKDAVSFQITIWSRIYRTWNSVCDLGQNMLLRTHRREVIVNVVC